MISPEALKTTAQWFKYIGIALTSLISLYGLGRETFDKQKQELTPLGKRDRKLLIASGILALVGAVVENNADLALRAQDKRDGDEVIRKQLEDEDKKFRKHLEDGNQKLTKDMQDANKALTKNLEPRFNNIIKEQQEGTEQSVNQINEATRTLQASMGDLVPLSELKTSVELKDFALQEVKPAPTSYAPDRYRATPVDRPLEDAEFKTIICGGNGQQNPWELEIPITTGIKVVAGMRQDNGSLRENCALPAFTKLPNSGNVSKPSSVETCRSTAQDVVLYWATKRKDLPLELAWFLNKQALEVETNNWEKDQLLLTLKLEGRQNLTAIPKTIVVIVSATSAVGPPEYISRTYSLHKEPHYITARVGEENPTFTFSYDLNESTKKLERKELEPQFLFAENWCPSVHTKPPLRIPH